MATDAVIKADNTSIDAACGKQMDVTTPVCANEVVGKGLLKCLHSYKRVHKEYKFSEGCKAAMIQRHEDKKAGK